MRQNFLGVACVCAFGVAAFTSEPAFAGGKVHDSALWYTLSHETPVILAQSSGYLELNPSCSHAALDEEANNLVASFGSQPSQASAAWRYAYDVVQGLLALTEEQAQRCPDIDLNAALQYHRSNLQGLEEVGRAAGWM